MPLQGLYIKEENLIKLRKEGNMSALINQLLTDYFYKNENKTIEDLQKELELLDLEEKKLKLQNGTN